MGVGGGNSVSIQWAVSAMTHNPLKVPQGEQSFRRQHESPSEGDLYQERSRAGDSGEVK